MGGVPAVDLFSHAAFGDDAVAGGVVQEEQLRKAVRRGGWVELRWCYQAHGETEDSQCVVHADLAVAVGCG